MRSLQDVYADTNDIDNSTLYSLFVGTEPLSFKVAMENEKWRLAMNEEIKAIHKNDTC